MSQRPRRTPHAHPTLSEIAELVGGGDPSKHLRILETGATFAEIEQALLWASGADDVMADEERPLSGRVAAVYRILTEDEETG